VSNMERSAKDELSFDEHDPNTGKDAQSSEEQTSKRTDSHDLVRLVKSVAIRKSPIGDIDRTVVSPDFYNSFNFPLLEQNRPGVNLTIGITSANRREGKTLVVANLAVSLALAHQRETVVVDLNVRTPQLHNILGTSQSPGLIEALTENYIEVSKTSVQHLYVLPAGNLKKFSVLVDPYAGQKKLEMEGTSMGLEHVAAFRDVLYSLKQKFDFVIVDMPSIQEPAVPMAITHQMEGIIAVISANTTTHRDIQKMFTKINQNQVLGFVFNRVPTGIFR
jgi:Mrp family chromosome partitioning ATPase